MVAVLGCTASGKSALAEAMACEFQRIHQRMPTIMAVDSMQVYRGMDIGTSKPSLAARQQIPHAMIDVVNPWESYSAAEFRIAASRIIADHQQRQQPLIMVVGTILYFKALTEGLFAGPSADTSVREELGRIADENGTAALHERLLQVDPVAAERIHRNDRRRLIRALEVHRITGKPISELQQQWITDRPKIDIPLIVVDRPRDEASQRINQRVGQMIKDGLLDEVRRLTAQREGLSMQAAQAVGYKEMIEYLNQTCSFDDAVERIKINTRHLAKLQRTWLRRYDASHVVRPAADQPVESFAADITRQVNWHTATADVNAPPIAEMKSVQGIF